MSEGFVLWGRFESGKPGRMSHKVIFYWSSIKKNRGAFLNKLYGYKTGVKRYEGLVARANGMRLGKSCVMLPIKYREQMTELTKKYRVDASTIEVFL
jgi:hypothetical protein